MTYSMMRTQCPRARSDSTHFVQTLDHQYRVVSRQVLDFDPLGFVDKRFRQSLEELAQIEISILELFCIGEGEHDIWHSKAIAEGVEGENIVWGVEAG